jgi:hypothetical protein
MFMVDMSWAIVVVALVVLVVSDVEPAAVPQATPARAMAATDPASHSRVDRGVLGLSCIVFLLRGDLCGVITRQVDEPSMSGR